VTASGPILLCTNDDGIHADGLALLARATADLGEVHVVAPDRQQSASSHALTLHRPLRLTAVDDRRHTVDGTPTDCVLIAIKDLLDPPPAFVFSGVNHGANMGEDVLYSGTVAAAMEATILGIPSAAISYVGYDGEHLSTYGPLVTELIEWVLNRESFPAGTLLNINLPDIPAAETRGVEITTLGKRVYHDSVTRHLDPRGREYLWIGGGRSEWRGNDDSDFRAVRAGYVSVTPLHLDLTDFSLIEEVKSWAFPG
jgi:5'-nucleotidase